MSDDFEKVQEDKPLDNMQINMAKVMIEDLHPIADTPIEVSFPGSCWIFGVFGFGYQYLNKPSTTLIPTSQRLSFLAKGLIVVS